MGVKCNIHVNRPQNDVYRPGSVLEGLVQYTLTADMTVDDIKMAIKGKTKVMWTRGAGKQRRTYRGNDEVIVDYGNILPAGTTVLPAGSYQSAFRFELPHTLPPSYRDRHCTTEYYLKITFTRPGFLTSSKKFRRMIFIGNAITPTLPLEPASYLLEKRVTEFFSSSTSGIQMKAYLSKSCLKPGEVIDISFELDNDTKHFIPTVKTCIMEKRIYRSNVGHEKETVKKIKNTQCHTGPIQKRDRGVFALKVCAPVDRFTIQNCRVFSREYYLHVVVKLPMPHRDGVMNVPIEIGDAPEAPVAVQSAQAVAPLPEESPPSYWEVMAEDMKNSKDSNDSD